MIEWELRRRAAQRRLWLLAGSLVGIGAGLFPLWHILAYGQNARLDIELFGLGFGVLAGGFEALKIAFIVLCTGLLAGDVQRRTHELVLATALPVWAYIWGRWIAGLILCSVLSLLLLGGVLAGNWIVYRADPARSFLVNSEAILSVWAFLAAVDVPVISALALIAGARWPHRTMALPAGLAALCILGPPLATGLMSAHRGLATLQPWVPDHLSMIGTVLGQYIDRMAAQPASYGQASGPSIEAVLQFWSSVWAEPVDLALWLPQLAYAGPSVGLVALLAWRFRRFPA